MSAKWSASETGISSAKSTSHVPAIYEEPLLVDPLEEHKQSWIVLHGRGDEAHSFANGMMGFLGIPLPDGRSLQAHLPNVRFVFPTAAPRRARVFNRTKITQWFDVYSWSSTEHADWQIPGLRETSEWIHELIRREIDTVGAQNVVLGGLSQGCASSLISLLLWQGKPIKAVFGMSGWLPFKHVLESAIDMTLNDTSADVFERSERQAAEDFAARQNLYGTAVKWLSDALDIDRAGTDTLNKIPIFIVHGGRDQTVDTECGRGAAECLCKLGFDVEYQEYATLRHWIRSDELQDIVDFVARCGVP